MFNSVVFEVVIGLVLIYLLYSLLATVVSEIISTLLGLRAKNLKEAICWMLEDPGESGWFKSLFSSLRSVFRGPKKKDCPVTSDLYNLPDIKMMGSSGLFKSPSSIRKETFSSAILSLIKVDKNNFRQFHADSKQFLLKFNENKKIDQPVTGLTGKDEDQDAVAASVLKKLAVESEGDIDKFRKLVEIWFDKTMDQASEWYRRKMQLILFIVGFLIAWLFCTDTLYITKILSKDKNARNQVVALAVSVNETGRYRQGLTMDEKDTSLNISQKLDTLLSIKRSLDNDISQSARILGTGGWLPDSVVAKYDKTSGSYTYSFPIDTRCIKKKYLQIKSDLVLRFSFLNKVSYMFCLLWFHLPGFLLTAIAISLGAPFWFDSLNKVMKLRTAFKPDDKQKVLT